jgi:hypothetical protein
VLSRTRCKSGMTLSFVPGPLYLVSRGGGGMWARQVEEALAELVNSGTVTESGDK